MFTVVASHRKDQTVKEILVTGIVSIASVAVGFLGSFFLLKKEVQENRKERIRGRKITSAKMAIDAAAELLGSVSRFSEINKGIRIATNGKADLKSILNDPNALALVKSKTPELISEVNRYHIVMTNTWKAYGRLRMSFSTQISSEYVDFTNYLNSLIFEDVHAKWPEMLEKANALLEKVKREIDSARPVQ